VLIEFQNAGPQHFELSHLIGMANPMAMMGPKANTICKAIKTRPSRLEFPDAKYLSTVMATRLPPRKIITSIVLWASSEIWYRCDIFIFPSSSDEVAILPFMNEVAIKNKIFSNKNYKQFSHITKDLADLVYNLLDKKRVYNLVIFFYSTRTIRDHLVREIQSERHTVGNCLFYVIQIDQFLQKRGEASVENLLVWRTGLSPSKRWVWSKF
jgi:hypothetical protein